MVIETLPMFQRHFEYEGRTREFRIATTTAGGWDVVEALDRHEVRRVHYDDWHRVERARIVFELQAQRLEEAGWVAVDRPRSRANG
jgi:hypothetical protein